MKRETSIKQNTHNHQANRGKGKSTKPVSSVKVKHDSEAEFVASANEHMLRAWESIHKNGKSRKAN